MALTKATYSMINGAPFNVLDYADLAEVVTARSPGDPASHLFTSFLCWDKPIKAALDACFDAGGGTVVLAKNTVPYYVRDVILVKSNTTFICEDWIILADYNFEGGTLGASGDNIVVQNLQIDNSNIYAGGSGYNGIGAGGKNITFNGGIIKNCQSGNNGDGTGDGGKGCQLEPGDGEDIVIDGMTFDNCFMAMSTIRDFGTPEAYYGIIYSNITAYNCKILFFVRQANGAQSQTGLQHTIQLNNFYANGCGTFEGVMQFSRASNVMVSNGVVVVDPTASAQPLIRGNHANCTFTNIGWFGNAVNCVSLDPSTYAVDSSQPNENNVYDINVWGQVNYFADANITTTNRVLNGCSGNVTFRLEPATAFFGNELRNGTSVFNLSCNTGPFGNSKFVLANTNLNFDGSTLPDNFAGFADGYNYSQVSTVAYTNFIAVASAGIANDTLFLDTSTGKLSYKNSAGVVNALY